MGWKQVIQCKVQEQRFSIPLKDCAVILQDCSISKAQLVNELCSRSCFIRHTAKRRIQFYFSCNHAFARDVLFRRMHQFKLGNFSVKWYRFGFHFCKSRFQLSFYPRRSETSPLPFFYNVVLFFLTTNMLLVTSAFFAIVTPISW